MDPVTVTASIFTDLNTGLLLILLGISSWFDIRFRRIPNWLIVAGMTASFGTQALNGIGNLSSWGMGLLVGFGLFIPLYIVKTMGAGDVKLMAMVGGFVGPAAIVGVVLISLIAGGILALAVALWSGTLRRTLTNTRFLLTDTMFKAMHGGGAQITAPPVSSGNLPYAVAIAAGTLIQLLLMRTGHTLLG